MPHNGFVYNLVGWKFGRISRVSFNYFCKDKTKTDYWSSA